MNKIIRLLSVTLFCSVFQNLSSQSLTEGRDKFSIERTGLQTLISSRNLQLTVNIVKPSTFPESSDPGKWKVINETPESRKLAGVAGELQTTTYETNIGLMICEAWTPDSKDLIAFRQTFTNKTKKQVRLNTIFPLYIEGKDPFSFGEIKNWRILEQFRRKNDLPVTEMPVASKSVICDPFFIINNNNGNGNNLFIGFQTFSLHLADISISFDRDLRLNNISANCDFEGTEVPPDGSRTSQWVVISAGDDTNQLIDDYTGRLREYYGVKEPARDAPSVYCTWYYHADNYNEEIFGRDIAQFRKEHIPFDVFLIDECWDVNDWGDFEANESFPGGMKRVAAQINSAGYNAGIWTAPFLVDGESDLAKEHPGWLLKNCRGVRCTFNMNNRDHFILDLTYPGVSDYLEEQFRKISGDWGYKYFKFDFMRSVFLDTDQQFYDRSATSLEAYRRGLEAIRRGTGSDAYISVCGGHYGASFGIANTQRSGSDVKSRWDETELPKYRQNILRTWMGALWHVDPDAMMVRKQTIAEPADKRGLTTGFFTDDEAFTNALNQFIGGNLITFTEDFAKIDEERKMLYKYVIPSVNSPSRPVDLFNLKCPEIMVTKITPGCEKLKDWNMLSIINWSDEDKTYSIPLDDMIISNLQGESFLVFDFQEQIILGWFKKGETITVEKLGGHHSKLLKIIEWDGKSAMFVGTDLNFSCGGVEIADIEYNNGSFSGEIETGWYVPVKLSFVIPSEEGYKLNQVTMEPGQKRFITAF